MSDPKIAICTADVGSGHSRAASALRDALLTQAPSSGANIINALDCAPFWFVKLYRDVYLDLVGRIPKTMGRAYVRLDRPQARAGMLDRLQGRILSRLLQHPEVANADVIATTHFLCASVLSWARAKGELRAPLVVCVTDQHPHAIWRVPEASLFIVASESGKDHLVRTGLDAGRVVATGIPIDPAFGAASRVRARVALGLPSDRPVVLLCGGGLGLGGIDEVARQLMRSAVTIHIVVVCGHNTELHDSLSPLTGPVSGREPSLEVHGFTNRMPEFLAAADLLVGKPGGLTTSEAAASGLPMVFLRPLPGQEERNASCFVAAGAAVPSRDSTEAAQLAVQLVTDRERLMRMADAASRLGRPRSAEDAARRVLSLCADRAQEAQAHSAERVRIGPVQVAG